MSESNNKLSVSSELYDELLQRNAVNSESCAKLSVKFMDGVFVKTINSIEVDSDGDLLVDRQRKKELVLEVSLSTKISGVGLQLWRGALLLSDYLIHTKEHNVFDKIILELGSGVGLTSIIASMFSKRVIATDIDQDGILQRIESNLNLNAGFVKADVSVSALNFCSPNWTASLTSDIIQSDVIIAADVIYDNILTDAFINTLTKILLTSKKKAIIALEKRYVFTLDELNTVAPCYEYFLQKLKASWNSPPMSHWIIRCIDIDFPQYLEYERSNHLVIWEICS